MPAREPPSRRRTRRTLHPSLLQYIQAIVAGTYLVGMLLQAVFGRLGGYHDVNDAGQLHRSGRKLNEKRAVSSPRPNGIPASFTRVSASSSPTWRGWEGVFVLGDLAVLFSVRVFRGPRFRLFAPLRSTAFQGPALRAEGLPVLAATICLCAFALVPPKRPRGVAGASLRIIGD